MPIFFMSLDRFMGGIVRRPGILVFYALLLNYLFDEYRN
jgi:hypothetical protein